MNSGFYVVFSTALLLMWAMMFFIFDRMTLSLSETQDRTY